MAHIYEAIDGQPYTLDGIAGTIRVEGESPYTRVTHYKSDAGRRTEAYQATKRMLRDDWDTDLTYSERLVSIFYDLLGTEQAERLCALPSEGSSARRSA